MKRLVLECSYERFWPLIFGRNAKRVQVVDALRSFKCDLEGFAIICKIRFLDKGMAVNDFEKWTHQKCRNLLQDKDGSPVIFMSGDYPKTSGTKTHLWKNVFLAGPPEK